MNPFDLIGWAVAIGLSLLILSIPSAVLTFAVRSAWNS